MQKSGRYFYIKRFLDVIVSLMVLGIVLPLFPVIALAIKLDSPGPVFFWSSRIGRNGQPFKMLKLRTMVNGAEFFQKNTVNPNGKVGAVVKVPHDPRLTGIGKFLRVWSIDELPQLYHVLRGEMSLVGPRPILVNEVNLEDPIQHLRTTVLPGLTGPWQISGRSNVGFEKRLLMDVDYVKRCSLGLDLTILLRTLPAVCSKRGAF